MITERKTQTRELKSCLTGFSSWEALFTKNGTLSVEKVPR
jgi:hypothetical protein